MVMLPAQLRPDIKHMCPDCQVGQPSAVCVYCGGTGSVTEKALAAWQRAHTGGPLAG